LYDKVLNKFDIDGVNPLKHEDIKPVKRILNKIFKNAWFLPHLDRTARLLQCATSLFSEERIREALGRYRDLHIQDVCCSKFEGSIKCCESWTGRSSSFYSRFCDRAQRVVALKPVHGLTFAYDPIGNKRWTRSTTVVYKHRSEETIESLANFFDDMNKEEFFDASTLAFLEMQDDTLPPEDHVLPHIYSFRAVSIEQGTLHYPHVFTYPEMKWGPMDTPNENRIGVWGCIIRKMFERKTAHEIMLSVNLRFFEQMMPVFVSCGVSRGLIFLFHGTVGTLMYDEEVRFKDEIYTQSLLIRELADIVFSYVI